MKLVIEPTNIKKFNCDGLILPLKNYSVQSGKYFTMEEIKSIINENKDKEIFISMNKNFFNKEIDNLKDTLLEIDKLNINGILFYDLSILELKRELNLKTDLVWNGTYMVNNYKTCNYYNEKGVKYALISKEITLEEIKEIINNSNITSMVEVVSIPSVAFSKRYLVSNYYKDLNKDKKESIEVVEKVTSDTYLVDEDDEGTNFYLDKIMNGTIVIKDLFESNCSYIVMKEYGIDEDAFYNLVNDTKKYIEGDCLDTKYLEKYKTLGDFTNFFFKKTIYKVKKNG